MGPRRAVVCGAGIAGLTTAWWLRRAGWDVVVVERAPRPRSAGYMIDFFGPGFAVADRMGLVPALRERAASITEVQYLDPAGHRRGSADYGSFRRAVDGRLLSLPRGDLADVLLAAVRDRVETRWATTVDGVSEGRDRLDVRLSDGTTRLADLLVGADGLHSRVRELVVAPGARTVRSLGYQTAAFVLDDDGLRRRVGRRMVLVAAPDRQVAVYPLHDGLLAAWLVHRASGPLPEDPRAAVRSCYGGLGPGVDRVLSHLTAETDLYYDDVAQTEVERWVRGRTVLVGDAACAPSLMAGQGASMAMAGAWALVGQVRRRPDDLATALRRYEGTVRPFAEERQAAGRRTARWLVPSSRRGIRARQGFLALAGLPGSGPLVRRAFGTEADANLPG
ncbi:FAD-dependent oxidoreductase [Actinotalea sp. AC32]|nr:FAD-dependent oxidoreductase [Actinotalea sp. AC32]